MNPSHLAALRYYANVTVLCAPVPEDIDASRKSLLRARLINGNLELTPAGRLELSRAEVREEQERVATAELAEAIRSLYAGARDALRRAREYRGAVSRGASAAGPLADEQIAKAASYRRQIAARRAHGADRLLLGRCALTQAEIVIWAERVAAVNEDRRTVADVLRGAGYGWIPCAA